MVARSPWGAAVGAALAVATTRLMAAQLSGVSATDPLIALRGD